MDPAPRLLTGDEYLAIAAELDDDMKWELVDGVMTPKASRVHVVDGVVMMAPERQRHARVKTLAGVEIHRAVRAAALPCRTTFDGMGVRITERSSYIPDVIVECGPSTPDDYLSSSPMIVVEVVSPPIRAKDITKKLVGYFSVESVAPYLIIDPEACDVQHHRRTERGIAVETHTAGITLRLDPPGIAVDLAAFFD